MAERIIELEAEIAELLADFERIEALCRYYAAEDDDPPLALLLIAGLARAVLAKDAAVLAKDALFRQAQGAPAEISQ